MRSTILLFSCAYACARQNDADVVRAVEISYVRLVRSDSEVMEDYGTIAQVQADYEERLFRSYAGEEVVDEL